MKWVSHRKQNVSETKKEVDAKQAKTSDVHLHQNNLEDNYWKHLIGKQPTRSYPHQLFLDSKPAYL